MKKVFLGGSRQVRALNEEIRKRLDALISDEVFVFVGDANGADKTMQTYFADRQYKNVLVFCSGAECRNNIGNWETRKIISDRPEKDFQFYTAKDTVMSGEADCGLMLWDGKSKGTLNNILNLLEQGKQVAVYFSPNKAFHDLRSRDDLKPLLTQCSPALLRGFEKKINLFRRLEPVAQQLSLI